MAQNIARYTPDGSSAPGRAGGSSGCREYRATGYPIGGGVVEGAQAMLHVRALYLNVRRG
jgi:hypothetical protein